MTRSILRRSIATVSVATLLLTGCGSAEPDADAPGTGPAKEQPSVTGSGAPTPESSTDAATAPAGAGATTTAASEPSAEPATPVEEDPFVHAGVVPVADIDLDVALDFATQTGYSISDRDTIDEDFGAQLRFKRAVLTDTHPWMRSASGSDAEAQDPGDGNLWLFLFYDAEFTSSLDGWKATTVDSDLTVNGEESSAFWYFLPGKTAQLSIEIPENEREFTISASMISDGHAGDLQTRSQLGPEVFTVTFPEG